MSRTATLKGRCYICREEFGKAAMKNHLVKHHRPAEGKTKYFMLKVEGYYEKDYWLYIQVKDSATLADLDDFLRSIWLECCGHLSSFIIDEETYDSDADSMAESFWDEETLDMKKYKLKDVLRKDMVFRHEYDFGSTTVLKLTVVDSYNGESTKDKVTLLARNNKPEYICDNCGKKASYIFLGENCDDFIPLCEDCIQDYEDEEEMIIEITNSPRMGVCAYSGEYDIYELD